MTLYCFCDLLLDSAPLNIGPVLYILNPHQHCRRDKPLTVYNECRNPLLCFAQRPLPCACPHPGTITVPMAFGGHPSVPVCQPYALTLSSLRLSVPNSRQKSMIHNNIHVLQRFARNIYLRKYILLYTRRQSRTLNHSAVLNSLCILLLSNSGYCQSFMTTKAPYLAQ